MKTKRFGSIKISEMKIFKENKIYGHSRVCDTLKPFARIRD
jgi:hypothetical protein